MSEISEKKYDLTKKSDALAFIKEAKSLEDICTRYSQIVLTNRPNPSPDPQEIEQKR